MESLYFLIPLSIVVLGVAVSMFWWAVRNGQYDDLKGEAERILFDNPEVSPGVQVGVNAGEVKRDKPERESSSVNDD